jgi:threonine dehydrogenase-like Zn-dependent dehydrogenase
MERARALWHVGPGRCEVRDEPLQAPRAGEVLVEALYSGVSRGTESLVLAGRVPESEFERMRGPHMGGAFPFPVKYGYQSVGRLADGRAVFCLHPHQSRYVVPESDVIPLPDGVPAARAILAANCETALNGLWDAEARLGDRLAVVGGGVVGSLVAYLAARAGCEVQLVDVEPARARVAAALGVGFATPDRARGDCDRVIHASGAPAGLPTALALAGTEATVVEMSWYGNRTVELPLGGAFHARRITIRSSQVGALPPEQRPRWSHRRRLELALSFLRDPPLDALIDGECTLDELPAVLPQLRGLCQRVRYQEG